MNVPRLSKAQRYMLETLRLHGPFSITDMKKHFGRRWQAVWLRLRILHLTWWDEDPRTCHHYRAKKETEITCQHCGAELVLENDGFGTEQGVCLTHEEEEL